MAGYVVVKRYQTSSRIRRSLLIKRQCLLASKVLLRVNAQRERERIGCITQSHQAGKSLIISLLIAITTNDHRFSRLSSLFIRSFQWLSLTSKYFKCPAHRVHSHYDLANFAFICNCCQNGQRSLPRPVICLLPDDDFEISSFSAFDHEKWKRHWVFFDFPTH